MPSFSELQARLPGIWRSIETLRDWDHTAVIVPSLSFHPEELVKIPGFASYEERLLFTLTRLRHPRARVAYLTSQPIHSDIIDYHLHHLVGVPPRHAMARLHLLCVYDGSPQPLTQKILERPRVIERLKRWIGDPERAYLSCFNSTRLERELAETLGIALNGVDPDLLWLGTKSGSRKVFREAGVACAAGFEDLRSEAQVVEALAELARLHPGLRRALIKLDDSFSGSGNAVLTYPQPPPAGAGARPEALGGALAGLRFAAPGESLEPYLRKLAEMGGIVEEFVEDEEIASPSAQLRINPDGEVALISTHDQVLGGEYGQVYQGCRFPADAGYRSLIAAEGLKVGRALRDRGVISRFGVDFVVHRRSGAAWRAKAVEINLRMGGTTPPFMVLQFLTGGSLDPESGEFLSPRGSRKFYYATDTLSSPGYRGLLAEDFLDILVRHGLEFDSVGETGVLFHMIGALSEHGKVGVTCIGNIREEADALFRATVRILDHETGGAAEGPPPPVCDRVIAPME